MAYYNDEIVKFAKNSKVVRFNLTLAWIFSLGDWLIMNAQMY